MENKNIISIEIEHYKYILIYRFRLIVKKSILNIYNIECMHLNTYIRETE